MLTSVQGSARLGAAPNCIKASALAWSLFACSSGGSMQAPMVGAGAGGTGAPAAGTSGGAAVTAGSGGGQRSTAGAAANSGSAGAAGKTAAAGSGGAADEDAGTSDSAGPGGATGAAGSGTSSGSPPALQPIDPPVADDCIKDVSAGDHTFSCEGLTYLVLVDPMCTKNACGLIFDIHGATMSGAQMRDNTLMYKIAPAKGYIVVNPSATASNTGGTWDLTNDPPTVAGFMDRTIKAFHVDPARIHVGGFSQGSAMTFWFLCNRKDILASAAPVSGASANVTCFDDSWPRIPIFYENGTKDQASMIDSARTMVDKIVSQLKLTGGMEIAGDGHYTRKHWEGDRGMLFDYIEHDYGGQPVLDGHCIPGGVDTSSGRNNYTLNATTCTTGDIKINWGQLALQWYIDHPKK